MFVNNFHLCCLPNANIVLLSCILFVTCDNILHLYQYNLDGATVSEMISDQRAWRIAKHCKLGPIRYCIRYSCLIRCCFLDSYATNACDRANVSKHGNCHK